MATLTADGVTLDVDVLDSSSLADVRADVLHFRIAGGPPDVSVRASTGLAGEIDYLCATAELAAAVHALHKANGVLELDTFDRTNLARDPHLVSAAWSQAGSTGTLTHATTGGPNGLGYFQYVLATATTTSPMQVPIGGTGTSAIPCAPGQPFTVSSYWWQSTNSNVQRYDVNWYDAAGATLSTQGGSDEILPGEPSSTWYHEDVVLTPPAGAAFGRPSMVWSGTYAAGQTLRVADVLVEAGSTVRPFFSGAVAPAGYVSTWSGAVNASTSRLSSIPALACAYAAQSVDVPHFNRELGRWIVRARGVQEVSA
jgi:hypothetical protein